VSPLCCTVTPAAAFPDRKLIRGPHISTPQGWRHAQWNVTEPPSPLPSLKELPNDRRLLREHTDAKITEDNTA